MYFGAPDAIIFLCLMQNNLSIRLQGDDNSHYFISESVFFDVPRAVSQIQFLNK